ncbi:unnamed protein product [Caenorhabditis angaria]|uniref:Uncharacterized protein n=1 Tax=Caenorhabditis angaria TaxID=860376 RepID=A0A9P1IIA6_9PELO|nr:unnamed protein product [Caenorhabditis angaria]
MKNFLIIFAILLIVAIETAPVSQEVARIGLSPLPCGCCRCCNCKCPCCCGCKCRKCNCPNCPRCRNNQNMKPSRTRPGATFLGSRRLPNGLIRRYYRAK